MQQGFSGITSRQNGDNITVAAPEVGNGYREDINEVLKNLGSPVYEDGR